MTNHSPVPSVHCTIPHDPVYRPVLSCTPAHPHTRCFLYHHGLRPLSSFFSDNFPSPTNYPTTIQTFTRRWHRHAKPNLTVSSSVIVSGVFQLWTVISDKLVGTMLRARKRGLIDFEGEMLFQRRDDDVIVSLVKPMNEINEMFEYSGPRMKLGHVRRHIENELPPHLLD